MEITRLVRSPAVSVSTVENILKLIGGVFSGESFERFEKGHRKGDMKISKQFEQLVPLFKQVNTFDPEAIQSKYKFLMNSW